MVRTFLMSMILFSSAFAADLDYSTFNQIPIQHEGRVKPLDTFARSILIKLSSKQSLDGMSAIEWLAEVLFDNERAFERLTFLVRNNEVLWALGIESVKSHRYAFLEISQPLKNKMNMINSIHDKAEKDRSPTQNQLLDLYIKAIRYYEIARSLSLLKPDMPALSEELATKLNLQKEINLTYLDFLEVREAFQKQIDASPQDQEIVYLASQLQRRSQDNRSKHLCVFPPSKKSHDKQSQDEAWLSPWQAVTSLETLQSHSSGLTLWKDMQSAYQTRQSQVFSSLSHQVYLETLNRAPGSVSVHKLKWELRYNSWNLFRYSMGLYIVSFLLLCLSWIVWPRVILKFSLVSILLGFVAHVGGLILRIYIMSRPPVSTLYESIVFVGFVGVLFALIYEFVKRNHHGLFIAAVMGMVLHFVAMGYERDGDTMGMLVAVLDTNFWLATHVLTITIGYGCCLVGGVLGHVYLVKKLVRRSSGGELKVLYQSMVGVTLFALFFSLLGTILGGIWADQSWGRFWGWDPKENGAMLICLWLLFLTHGRLSGYFKAAEYAFGMVITNIIVALAWFGVNLLNVGLHSYGFTDSIARNLFLFCMIELIFGSVCYALIRFRNRKHFFSS